jgi:FlaG/FlaF family flagellin (archaellin)
LNNKTTLAGTWNVTVTGPNYLSGSTGINIREKTPDALYDPFLNQIKLIDLRTNGVIASLTV